MDEHAAPESLSQYELKLRGWISKWYCHAATEGLVHPAFLLDDAVVERLEGYFFAGLTPAEGALAFFASMH